MHAIQNDSYMYYTNEQIFIRRDCTSVDIYDFLVLWSLCQVTCSSMHANLDWV